MRRSQRPCPEPLHPGVSTFLPCPADPDSDAGLAREDGRRRLRRCPAGGHSADRVGGRPGLGRDGRDGGKAHRRRWSQCPGHQFTSLGPSTERTNQGSCSRECQECTVCSQELLRNVRTTGRRHDTSKCTYLVSRRLGSLLPRAVRFPQWQGLENGDNPNTPPS